MAEGERELVRFEKDGDIGVITVDNPPVNALSPGVPEGIIAALDKGNADPAVKAMVLIGAGRSFIAGADIRQFGKAPATPPANAPSLRRDGRQPEAGRRGDPRLCARRRARDRARLPLPRRGAERQSRTARGADRHPARRRRHAAAAAADRPEGGARHDRLRPACPGRGGAQARHRRRDRAGEASCKDAAIAFARRIADKRPLPRIRDKTTGSPRARRSCSTACANRSRAAPATSARPMPASRRSRRPARCRSTRAARVERKLFDEQVNSDEAKALRYAFFAEREVAKLPHHPGATRQLRPTDNRGGGRRRHDGRRHRDELCRLRLCREDHRRDAGGARARHGAHPRQLRDQRQARQPRRRRDGAAPRPHRAGRRASTTSPIATSSSRRCSSRSRSRRRSGRSSTR